MTLPTAYREVQFLPRRSRLSRWATAFAASGLAWAAIGFGLALWMATRGGG